MTNKHLTGSSVVWASILWLSACNAGFDHDGFETTAATAAEALRASIEDSPGVALRVLVPSAGVDFRYGSGDLQPDMPLRVASNTKTVVAAAILRLMEEGELSLDQSLSEFSINPDVTALLEGDAYDLEAIQIRHLLLHTGGLYDYASDTTHELAVLSTPQKEWTALEQIQEAVDLGDPLFVPGEGFAYSDTGYLLLAMVLESVTGEDFATAARRLVRYEELQLDSTWWEVFEPVQASPFGPQFFGTLPRDHFSPHIDLHGGGGLASSVDDLATLYQGLSNGSVFEEAATFELMTTMGEGEYHAGIFTHEAGEVTCFGHSGYWSTIAFVCPSIDLTVAYAWGQAVETANPFLLIDDVVAAFLASESS